VSHRESAVVTGSSRGIGRAIVERMAEHGARVVVSSRHVEPCREVAAINVRLGELDRRAGLQLRCDTDASRLR
jgi:NAD(P)-dependent dehydrogenase (short-subunit alcohol dehydrogenase family)